MTDMKEGVDREMKSLQNLDLDKIPVSSTSKLIGFTTSEDYFVYLNSKFTLKIVESGFVFGQAAEVRGSEVLIRFEDLITDFKFINQNDILVMTEDHNLHWLSSVEGVMQVVGSFPINVIDKKEKLEGLYVSSTCNLAFIQVKSVSRRQDKEKLRAIIICKLDKSGGIFNIKILKNHRFPSKTTKKLKKLVIGGIHFDNYLLLVGFNDDNTFLTMFYDMQENEVIVADKEEFIKGKVLCNAYYNSQEENFRFIDTTGAVFKLSYSFG